MASLPPPDKTRARLGDIDFWRGMGCVAMVLAHPLRVQETIADAGGAPMPFAAQLFVLTIDIGAVIFFVAAGVGVLQFFERYGKRKDFSATRFYLANAAALFFLGYTYALALGTAHLGVPDIFQGVAMGTALTYVLLRAGAPNWLLFAVAYAIFNISGQAHALVPPTEEAFRRLPWVARFWFLHFAFFPWAGMVVIGALLYRVRSRAWLVALAVFFAAMLVYSDIAMRPVVYLDKYEMLMRASGTYTMRFVSASALLMFALRRIYPAGEPGHARGLIEYAGRESFLFLVHHLGVLALLLLARGAGLNLWLRALIVLVVSFSTLHSIAALRDKVMATRHGVALMATLLGASFVAGLFVMARFGPGAAMLVAFPSAYAFAFLHPWLRERLRRRYASA
ncbi:hypothetical protein K8I61_12140 [bacterium]|nr:hypothetical protein [bacterium]